MSLLPEYHATLSCRQSAENVNRTLASMSLSVSGTAYARRNSVQSASRFIFARHIPYSFSMLRRHIPLPTFLPTADMTVIPGAERTEVRLLFQPEDTTLLLMVMLYSALLAMELILIPIVFLTQASLLHYFSLLLFPIALVLFHCLGAHFLRIGAQHLMTLIAGYLGVCPVPELEKGCSFEE